jgi:hypothetical protein
MDGIWQTIFILAAILVGIALYATPSFLADSKGYSAGIALAVSLFLTPVVGLIIYFSLPDRLREKQDQAQLQRRVTRLEAQLRAKTAHPRAAAPAHKRLV